MKKIAIISLICITCISVHCQINLSPTGSIFSQETTLSNAGNTIDGLTSTVANVPYATSVTLTVKLDIEYHIGKIKLDAHGTDNDLYHLFYSSTGDPWDFTPVKSYNDPPLDNTLDFNAQYVKLMIENSSTISQISIKEFEIYEYIPPVVFNYDASGNRISRTIDIGGAKSGKMEGEMGPFEDKTSEGLIQIYPNPTEGQLAVKLLDFESLENARIQIFDLTGKRVYDNLNISHSNFIDLSDAAIGTYIIKIKVGESIHEWKIIKK
jgi:hypothetical protein